MTLLKWIMVPYNGPLGTLDLMSCPVNGSFQLRKVQMSPVRQGYSMLPLCNTTVGSSLHSGILVPLVLVSGYSSLTTGICRHIVSMLFAMTGTFGAATVPRWKCKYDYSELCLASLIRTGLLQA